MTMGEYSPTTLDLVRDVLDTQMLDELRDPMGRVDGLVLELRDGAPPRLAFIEMGGVVLARRIHPRLGAWLARVRGVTPFRIPWERVRNVGLDVEVDICRDDTPAMTIECWLRDHIVRHIPGS